MFTIAPSSKSSESRAKAIVLGINLNTDRLTRGNQRQTDGRARERPYRGALRSLLEAGRTL